MNREEPCLKRGRATFQRLECRQVRYRSKVSLCLKYDSLLRKGDGEFVPARKCLMNAVGNLELGNKPKPDTLIDIDKLPSVSVPIETVTLTYLCKCDYDYIQFYMVVLVGR